MIWEEKKMKKFLAVLLTLVMVLCLAACGQTQEPAPVEPAPVEPAPAEPAEVGFTLNLKNKTGVTITGLYLYESGAADKGHSLCKSEWLTKDESDEYEYNAFLYRDLTKTFDLYVTFADGTDATWPGLTLANYDKLSLKDGVDPAGWEQEPVDDAEDIALMDEIAAAGRTADHITNTVHHSHGTAQLIIQPHLHCRLRNKLWLRRHDRPAGPALRQLVSGSFKNVFILHCGQYHCLHKPLDKC